MYVMVHEMKCEKKQMYFIAGKKELYFIAENLFLKDNYKVLNLIIILRFRRDYSITK